ncbi:MAG: hypothetical protein CVT82_04460 [Alphaproteobacteria bacterium HGW-Alphaproteobacteria-4]|nr:MAG: hypothetical protein CVT82_04460 [Alphaproteobacteria bacterium HGW-Alphaproteobacteria-4]
MKHLMTLTALALFSAYALPAAAETLKVSSYLPPKHALNAMIEQWGKELAEKSGGSLTLELYPAAQLGPVNRQFDMAASGAADITVVLHSATPGRFPMTELAGLPLAAPSAGNASGIASPRLTALADEFLAGEHAGTKILWMAVTPPLKISLKKVEPTNLAVFKGLRIRYAGQVFQSVLETLGATPLPVPPAEVQEGLSKGIIDGTLFPYEALKAFDLGADLAYSMEPGIASATFAVVMNQAKFESLTADQQALIVATTGVDRAAAFGAMWDAGEEEGRAYVQSKGVKIVTLADDQKAALFEAITPIIDATISAVEATGKPGRAFYTAYVQ